MPSRQLERIVLTAFGVEPGKVFYIPNGIDQERFFPGPDPAWRAAHGVPHDALLIGTVGALRAEKNHTLLLRAIAQIRDQNIWLAFAGDGPCRDDLTHAARQLGIASRTLFAGSLSDTAPFYRALDLFALSSSTEQMPLSILEAMASALPIVATDVGDLREMLAPAETRATILVPRDDVHALSSSIAALSNDRDLRARLAQANRERCLKLYTQDRMFHAYRAAYERALGRRIAPPS